MVPSPRAHRRASCSKQAFRFWLSLLVAWGVLLFATVVLADGESDPAGAQRSPSTDANFIAVPYGVHYRIIFVGAGLSHSVPLSTRPGRFWDGTNVTYGLNDYYGLINNSLGGFAEVTPIAFFKLRIYAAWDTLFGAGIGDALRVLSETGRARLSQGHVAPDDPASVGWEDDYDPRDNYRPNVFGQGLRAKVTPTLQAKIGPIGCQYNFTADWNFYSGGGFGANDVFHDTFTFTLRKMRDFGEVHEAFLVSDVPVPGNLVVGGTMKYYRVSGTRLESFSLAAVARYAFSDDKSQNRFKPWMAVMAGTLLIDPMYRHEATFVLALGADVRL